MESAAAAPVASAPRARAQLYRPGLGRLQTGSDRSAQSCGLRFRLLRARRIIHVNPRQAPSAQVSSAGVLQVWSRHEALGQAEVGPSLGQTRERRNSFRRSVARGASLRRTRGALGAGPSGRLVGADRVRKHHLSRRFGPANDSAESGRLMSGRARQARGGRLAAPPAARGAQNNQLLVRRIRNDLDLRARRSKINLAALDLAPAAGPARPADRDTPLKTKLPAYQSGRGASLATRSVCATRCERLRGERLRGERLQAGRSDGAPLMRGPRCLGIFHLRQHFRHHHFDLQFLIRPGRGAARRGADRI